MQPELSIIKTESGFGTLLRVFGIKSDYSKLSASSKEVTRNPRVEKELEQLVSVITEVVPQLTEVRVFGSYHDGKWNPETSDIDVFVETGDENLSLYNYRRKVWDWTRAIPRQRIQETFQARVNRLSFKYRDRFHIQLLTPSDVTEIFYRDEGKGPIGKNMKNGRLLYSNNFRGKLI